MKSLRILDRRIGYILSAFAFLLAAVAPGLLTATVSADQLVNRSITLSSAAVGVSANTSYKVVFDAAGGAGAAIVDFCSNSPLIGVACTAPTGMDTASVSTSDGSTTVTSLAANTVKVVKTITAGTMTINLDNIKNPTSAGTFYARILTYTDGTGAGSYVDVTPGTHIDEGGVALSIVNTIGVTAAVLESMTFCVASATITADCGDASSNLPALELGETSGGVTALSASALSTGHIFTQISTNAATGAVINMKSNALNCGGLLRSSDTSACNIGPATTGGFAAGTAKFGVKTSTATAVGSGTGTLEPVSASGYNDTTYLMNFTAGNSAGVTSIYGDPFLDTGDAPVNNMLMDLTFGASISNNTPAGSYSADLSMIATGKF